MERRAVRRPSEPGGPSAARVATGGRIRIVENPAPDDVLLLAAVDPDGNISFRPNVNVPDPGDTLIGIVGGSGG